MTGEAELAQPPDDKRKLVLRRELEELGERFRALSAETRLLGQTEPDTIVGSRNIAHLGNSITLAGGTVIWRGAKTTGDGLVVDIIFASKEGIKAGENWAERIEDALAASGSAASDVEKTEENLAANADAFNDAAKHLLNVAEAALADMNKEREVTRNLLDRIDARLSTANGGR
ncbi:MAG TPA: hypothetical protein VMF86_04260 [Stellaceae bacterium]|nr:hypothetical protein [Stellaceae bacterium]